MAIYEFAKFERFPTVDDSAKKRGTIISTESGELYYCPEDGVAIPFVGIPDHLKIETPLTLEPGNGEFDSPALATDANGFSAGVPTPWTRNNQYVYIRDYADDQVAVFDGAASALTQTFNGASNFRFENGMDVSWKVGVMNQSGYAGNVKFEILVDGVILGTVICPAPANIGEIAETTALFTNLTGGTEGGIISIRISQGGTGRCAVSYVKDATTSLQSPNETYKIIPKTLKYVNQADETDIQPFADLLDAGAFVPDFPI